MPIEIAFLDLTGGKPFDLDKVQFIELDALVEKIRVDSGRTLNIRFLDALHYIGIVKYDAPVGYAVFAYQDIPGGENLFMYGGDIVDDASQEFSNPDYMLRVSDAFGTDKSLDAVQQGDIAALCPHLPKAECLERVEISDQHNQQIQFANLSRYDVEFQDRADIMFYSNQAIKRGRVLGFSYGRQYWFARDVSPTIFSKDANFMSNLVVDKPQICMQLKQDDISGTMVYSQDDFLEMIADNRLNTGPETNVIVIVDQVSSNILYMNKRMLQIAQTQPSKEVYLYVYAKELTQKVEQKRLQGETKLLLNHSIFANTASQRGPFRDVFVSDEQPAEEVDFKLS